MLLKYCKNVSFASGDVRVGGRYLDRLDLQLQGSVFVNHNHWVGVHLQTGQCPHVVHTTFDAPLKG